jgi:hypothetical protein
LHRAALETEERRKVQEDSVLSEAWMVIDGEAYDEDGNPIVLNNKKVCKNEFDSIVVHHVLMNRSLPLALSTD